MNPTSSIEPFSIVLDAGHGGADFGAVGPGKRREKDVALSVAMILGSLLIAAGVTVHYTRKDDIYVSLADRAKFANERNADLFLSIHCNSGPPGSGDGFEVFTTRGETASDPFATDLFLSYAAEFPWKRKRVDTADGDPDKESDFAVLRLTAMPAALFELEFIHTADGEAWLVDKANHARMARALFAGIMKHRGAVAAPSPAPQAPAPAVTSNDIVLAGEVLKRLQAITQIHREIGGTIHDGTRDLMASVARQMGYIDTYQAEIDKLLAGGTKA